MLRSLYAKIDQRKTVNKRPLRVSCKLAIFWARIGSGGNFIVRAAKCRTDDQQQNTYKLAIFWTAIRFSENLNVRAAKCRSDAKHQESRQKRRLIEV